MNPFHVWSRPVGDFCHVRVDSLENARWLLLRLSQSFVFKTFEPFGEEEGSTVCTFQVPYNPPLSRATFDNMLAAIPQVLLRREPA
jgi:hypothetical protein